MKKLISSLQMRINKVKKDNNLCLLSNMLWNKIIFLKIQVDKIIHQDQVLNKNILDLAQMKIPGILLKNFKMSQL